MNKIASTIELQDELQRLLVAAKEPNPSRALIASELRDLAQRIAGDSKETLHCDMEKDCNSPVSYIDNKGYVYCAKHGEQRKAAKPCRKLTPSEIKKLEDGGTIKYG